MVQVAKSTEDLELFLRLEHWHRQGEHRKFKSRSDFSQMILARCAVFGVATAEFRFM